MCTFDHTIDKLTKKLNNEILDIVIISDHLLKFCYLQKNLQQSSLQILHHLFY